jgi:hypothetical protein
METLRLEGWTTVERVAAIAGVKEAVARAGWLLDFTLFSSKALTVSFEIEGGGFRILAGDLAAAGVVLRPDSVRAVEDASALNGALMVSLHLLFMHDGTDMRIEVPPIPG